MASLTRLSQAVARRALFAPMLQPEAQMTLLRSITLRPKPYVPVDNLTDFDGYNLRQKRPQSPHLTIYAPQLTSMLSITHRGCGVGMSMYVFAIGVGALASPVQLSVLLDSVDPPTLLLGLVKLAIAFPISYHFCNGIRHLCWDMGKFLSLKGVYNTGYAMAAASVVCTAILMLL